MPVLEVRWRCKKVGCGAGRQIGRGFETRVECGAGEIVGTAVESALNVTLKIELVKNANLSWPRIENNDYIMSVGSYRPLEDAARIAYNDLVRWIAKGYAMDLQDAYQLLSQTAESDLTQMVDPNYTVVVKVAKKYLPAGEVMNGMHRKMRAK